MSKASDDVNKLSVSDKEYVFAYDETNGDQDFYGKMGKYADPAGLFRAVGFVINAGYNAIGSKAGTTVAEEYKRYIRKMIMDDNFWDAAGPYSGKIDEAAASKLN